LIWRLNLNIFGLKRRKALRENMTMNTHTTLNSDLMRRIKAIPVVDPFNLADRQRKPQRTRDACGAKGPRGNTSLSVATLCAAVAASLGMSTAAALPILNWTTVVNNSYVAPDPTNPDSTTTFNSYSPASVNDEALVAFRGRTQGGQGGQRVSGVFQRDMKTLAPVQAISTQGSLVPQPNNLAATFNEFPSFARIDSGSSLVATRGQSQPVWQYIDPSTGSDTRVGTSGIYATPGGTLTTGMGLLGAVPAFPQFQIPQPAVSSNGLRFDQFPGAPAAFDGKFIAFKGNYTENTVSQTGVFYRDIVSGGGTTGAVAIAWRGMDMPTTPYVPAGTTFGSTAPPSAAKGQVVFTGLDNEEAPTAGGIYLAKVGQPGLTTLVSIGETVSGVTNPGGTTLNRLGEGLSFDGRYVSFWGAWGNETRTVTLRCAADGNASVLAACMAQSDPDANGNPTGQTTREVPLHQGIFLKDTVTGSLQLVSQTGADYEDFLFWNFSGNAGQGGGEESEDEEGARWRSTAFIASDGAKVVFKATEPETGIFGLYLDLSDLLDPYALLTSAMFGEVLDSMATALPIVALSIERDGFRNGWLAVSASMADAENGWAGVYLTQVVPEPSIGALMVLALGVLAWSRRRRGGRSDGFRPEALGNV
jgi:hypothetical protein